MIITIITISKALLKFLGKTIGRSIKKAVLVERVFEGRSADKALVVPAAALVPKPRQKRKRAAKWNVVEACADTLENTTYNKKKKKMNCMVKLDWSKGVVVVFFDMETTGLSTYGDFIIQMAFRYELWVRITDDDGKEELSFKTLGTFDSYVHCDSVFPQQATDVNGIKPARYGSAESPLAEAPKTLKACELSM